MTGKGMFTWQLAHCCDGSLSEIVAKAARAGLSHVLVKLADGTGAYGGQRARDLCRALRDGGMDSVGWTYTRGRDIAAEVALIAAQARAASLSWFVLNAEVEYAATGMGQRAGALVSGLRNAAPSLKLALSSYYLPSFHAEFPWRAWSGVDLIMPQVYWYSRDPAQALTGSLTQNRATFPGKPILPTGAAYPEAMVGIDHLRAFLCMVKAKGLTGVNFWSWQQCPPEAWTVIRDLEL